MFAAEKANMDIDPNQLTAIFIAGATIAFGKSALWLKGWQDFEKGQQMPADALLSADDVGALSEDDTIDGDEEAGDVAVAERRCRVRRACDRGRRGAGGRRERETDDSHLVLNGVSG